MSLNLFFQERTVEGDDGAFLESILISAPCAITVVDSAGLLLYENPKATEFYHLSGAAAASRLDHIFLLQDPSVKQVRVMNVPPL